MEAYALPPSGWQLTASIPFDVSPCGVSYFVQMIEIDPAASKGLSFTPGLELRIGR